MKLIKAILGLFTLMCLFKLTKEEKIVDNVGDFLQESIIVNEKSNHYPAKVLKPVKLKKKTKSQKKLPFIIKNSNNIVYGHDKFKKVRQQLMKSTNMISREILFMQNCNKLCVDLDHKSCKRGTLSSGSSAEYNKQGILICTCRKPTTRGTILNFRISHESYCYSAEGCFKINSNHKC